MSFQTNNLTVKDKYKILSSEPFKEEGSRKNKPGVYQRFKTWLRDNYREDFEYYQNEGWDKCPLKRGTISRWAKKVENGEELVNIGRSRNYPKHRKLRFLKLTRTAHNEGYNKDK